MDYRDSVVLITSATNKHFGTGFVLGCAQDMTWIVTCAHVLMDVGGAGQVLVRNQPAVVLACGKKEKVDLAVLGVHGLDIRPLTLGPAGRKGVACRIHGYATLAAPIIRGESLDSTLDEQTIFEMLGHRVRTWRLLINGKKRLVSGYSGSPVICTATKTVFAVISHSEGIGDQGYAVWLGHLQEIWKDMPRELVSLLHQQRCLTQELWEFLEDLFQKLTLKKIPFLMVVLAIIATSIIIWASKSTNYALYIKSEILPAKVYVDNRYVETLTDNSPDTTINVSEGEHIVSIQSNGFNEKKPIRVTSAENPQIILFSRNIDEPVLASQCFENLLDCSIPTAISVPKESTLTIKNANGKLEVDFRNNENGSGIAFQFTPHLNLNDCHYLELNATSTEAFQFRLEYKIRSNDKLEIVGTSAPQTFQKTSEPQSVKTLLNSTGKIDEIAINFFNIGNHSHLVIKYIRLIC